MLLLDLSQWRQYWRATGIKFGGINALFDAFSASASLRYRGGDNAGGSPGCPSSDDRSSNARKYYHHLTFYGFMMCFASTSLGTIYHYFLGREAPYGYFELPVLLGTVGGIILCIGTAGLWIEKRRMDPAVRSWRSLGMDYAFIGLLFWVSLTGLILALRRHHGWADVSHPSGVCLWFLLVLPFSKFVHGLYRFAALIQSASESKSINLINHQYAFFYDEWVILITIINSFRNPLMSENILVHAIAVMLNMKSQDLPKALFATVQFAPEKVLLW